MQQKREQSAGLGPLDIDGRTLAVLAGMYGALLGNAWLYFALPGSLPLPLHVLVAAAAIHCAFTVWHEAAHRNVSKTRWLNDLVGVVGIFPYMTPFFLQKRVHLRHHQHVNDPEDPNLIYAGGPYWQLPYRYLQIFRYASELVQDDPRNAEEKRLDYAALAAVGSAYLVALVAGFLPALLLLWLLPMLIAKFVMDWYINYLPHVGLPTDRYGATRVPWDWSPRSRSPARRRATSSAGASAAAHASGLSRLNHGVRGSSAGNLAGAAARR